MIIIIAKSAVINELVTGNCRRIIRIMIILICSNKIFAFKNSLNWSCYLCLSATSRWQCQIPLPLPVWPAHTPGSPGSLVVLHNAHCSVSLWSRWQLIQFFGGCHCAQQMAKPVDASVPLRQRWRRQSLTSESSLESHASSEVTARLCSHCTIAISHGSTTFASNRHLCSLIHNKL